MRLLFSSYYDQKPSRSGGINMIHLIHENKQNKISSKLQLRIVTELLIGLSKKRKLDDCIIDIIISYIMT